MQQYREEAENSSDYARIMSDQLKRSEVLAGLTEVEGEGIILTLTDSTWQTDSNTVEGKELLLIHDGDLRQAISELAAAGAEAYSINGQRVISTTPIRCVGPVITVNEQKMAPPYEISVIGDPKTLEAAVNMRGGLADLFRAVGIGVEVRRRKRSRYRAIRARLTINMRVPVIQESGEEQR